MSPGPQLSLFIDPAPARRDDTSRAAAERLQPKLGRLRLAVLNAIRAAGADGLTADEVAAAIKVSEFTARPRVSELRNKFHLIRASGRRRPSSQGLPMIVWVAQPASADLPSPAEAGFAKAGTSAGKPDE